MRRARSEVRGERRWERVDIGAEYGRVEARLRMLLPEKYQDSYQDVQPVAMGSAGLKYGDDGGVAWDEIWQTFCHLAMAGGPPHRGTLLEPATGAEMKLQPERYGQVAAELCRGVQMVTGLAAEPSPVAGWIAVDCPNRGMAGWLARAITMENVSAHADGMALHLPAGPGYRVEKEIKNVVVAMAKTCHYWVGHMSLAQRRAVGELLGVMEGEAPLLQAPFDGLGSGVSAERLRAKISAAIGVRTGLVRAAAGEGYGWVGVECGSVQAAVWMMRVAMASNVLARREGTALYVPVHATMDGDGERVAGVVVRAYELARAEGVMEATAP